MRGKIDSSRPEYGGITNPVTFRPTVLAVQGSPSRNAFQTSPAGASSASFAFFVAMTGLSQLDFQPT